MVSDTDVKQVCFRGHKSLVPWLNFRGVDLFSDVRSVVRTLVIVDSSILTFPDFPTRAVQAKISSSTMTLFFDPGNGRT